MIKEPVVMNFAGTPSATPSAEALAHMAADLTKMMIGSGRISDTTTALETLGAFHQKLTSLASSAAETPTATKQEPAVNPKKSIHDDFIICLEDGKKFKSLKRHIMTHYNLTPEAYREKWGLSKDYPMVAPNYAAARSELAKKMGLGKKR